MLFDLGLVARVIHGGFHVDLWFGLSGRQSRAASRRISLGAAFEAAVMAILLLAWEGAGLSSELL